MDDTITAQQTKPLTCFTKVAWLSPNSFGLAISLTDEAILSSLMKMAIRNNIR